MKELNSNAFNLISDFTASDSDAAAPVNWPATRPGWPFPDQLPLLPMEELNIFPLVVYPISVEEPGAKSVILQSLQGPRLVGLFAVKEEGSDPRDLTIDDFHPVGVAALVHKVSESPGQGPMKAVVQGVSRIRLKKLDSPYPYAEAAIERLDETWEDSPELSAMMREAKKLMAQVIEMSPYLSPGLKGLCDGVEQPGVLSDLIVSALPLKRELKIEFIGLYDVKARLERLLEILTQEKEILELGRGIQKKVQAKMEKHHKEMHLREQLKAIQEELGEGGGGDGELDELRAKMDQKAWPEEVKAVAEKELNRMIRVGSSSPEYSVARTYIDWLLDLPWQDQTVDNLDLPQARTVLDRDHFGLEQVKKRILEYLAVRKLKKDLKGPILCLVGPPGVGKTSLGQSLAEALGRKFVRLSLGGVRDEAEIRGHRRTYVGAMPGRIIAGLKKAQTNNPVFLLDEVDKMSYDFRGDPSSALLEALDPEQNNTFSDHYLEVPFDLSQVMFIMTANVLDQIPGPLRDRMEVIHVSSYTAEEKLAIAKGHLLPKSLEAHGLAENELTVSDEALEQVISCYTREAGCRELTRRLNALSRAAAVAKASGVDGPSQVTPCALPTLLGPPRFTNEQKAAADQVGVATGLAWTAAGGDILFIEAVTTPGNGVLKLTGQLGDVMKESAQAALTFIKARAPELDLPANWLKGRDIHIHLPQGAIPKDGPSAGVTLATVLASLASGRPVRSDVAMTGEISLTGQVLAVGGIKEKVLAAKRAGLKKVYLPKANQHDLAEIPADLLKGLKVELVDQASQVIKAALAPVRSRARKTAQAA